MVISTATSLDGENFDELRKSLNIQLIVQKPINPATFLQQVEKFLAGQSQAAVPPADVIVSSLGIVADAEESNFLIELERELDVARGVYLRDTTKELNDFASRINFIDASDSIVVNEVRHLSHKIRGTSGSYRLTEVSKLAGMIEDLLSPGANDSCDENEYLSSAISALMFELRQSVENELKLRDPLALDAIKSGR
jgi:hypothetical protein